MNDQTLQPFRGFAKLNVPLIVAVSAKWKPTTFRALLCYSGLAIHGRIIDNVSISREISDILCIHPDTLKDADAQLKASKAMLEKRRGYVEINADFAYKGRYISGQDPYLKVFRTEEMSEVMKRYHLAENRHYKNAFKLQYSEVAMNEILRLSRMGCDFVPMSVHIAALQEKDMLIEDWKKQHEKIMEVQNEHLKLIHEIRAELRKYDPAKAESYRYKVIKGGKSERTKDHMN